jgi:hypothetical protein
VLRICWPPIRTYPRRVTARLIPLFRTVMMQPAQGLQLPEKKFELIAMMRLDVVGD